MILAITNLVNHLSSAGIINHGASLVEVCSSISSYAFRYSFHMPLSLMSPEENFQFFEGSLILSKNLFFCSFLDTCRKNFIMTVPFSTRVFSKWLICLNLFSQNDLSISVTC